MRSHPMLVLAALSVVILTSEMLLGAPAHACDLVGPLEVARILGNDAPIVGQHPAVDRDGVRTSSCLFQQASGAGNTGNLQMSTYSSSATAQEGLAKYLDAMVKLGGATQIDSAAGVRSAFVTSKRGSGEMYAVKGNVLLGAGVSTLAPDHKSVMPLRDRSRALLVAALAKL